MPYSGFFKLRKISFNGADSTLQPHYNAPHYNVFFSIAQPYHGSLVVYFATCTYTYMYTIYMYIVNNIIINDFTDRTLKIAFSCADPEGLTGGPDPPGI